MNFRTIMMSGCAVLATLALEPATGLLKVTVALGGAAMGAILAPPLEEEAAHLRKQVQSFKSQMSQRPAEPVVVVD